MTTNDEMLPEFGTSWEELESFCANYDGYADGHRSWYEIQVIAEKVTFKSLPSYSVDEIRLPFLIQRKARWGNEGVPADQDIQLINAAVDQLRKWATPRL